MYLQYSVTAYLKTSFGTERVAPAEFFHGKTPCKREVGDIAEKEQRVFFVGIVDGAAVDGDLACGYCCGLTRAVGDGALFKFTDRGLCTGLFYHKSGKSIPIRGKSERTRT